MLLHCPACESAFSGVTRCPRCGGLLLMPHEVSPDAVHPVDESPAPLRPTALGRIVVGTVLSLGLYLAVRKLVLGAVLAEGHNPTWWWQSFPGLAAIHASQAVAVAFGAVIASAGRAKGYPLGLVVGLACGGLFLGYELRAGAPPQDLVLYLQAPVLAMLGLLAGAVGSRVWGAAPRLEMPEPAANKLSSIRLTEDAKADHGRPTLWARVLVGASIMVLGVAVADVARQSAQQYSGGIVQVTTVAQAEFITWQLATFAVLLGGLAAGAGTGAGVRHGILAGMVGGIGVVGLCAEMGRSLPPVEYWLVNLSLNGLPLLAPAVVVGIAGGVLFAGLVGGWLGGALFLPLAPEHMRRRPRLGLD